MHIVSMPALQMFDKIFLNKILHNQIISDGSSTIFAGTHSPNLLAQAVYLLFAVVFGYDMSSKFNSLRVPSTQLKNFLVLSRANEIR